MEYQTPYPSSVPHIILTPASFTLDKVFFSCSIILQSFFLFICALLFGLSIYFRIGNHKLLIDHSNNPEQEKQKQNIICQVVEKSQFFSKRTFNFQQSQKQEKNNVEENNNSLDQQLFANQLRMCERRIVYFACFTIPWVFCITFFRLNIVIVILASVMLGCVIVFNIKKMMPQWKFTILVYFVPAIGAFIPYMSGSGSLYSWKAVLSPTTISAS